MCTWFPVDRDRRACKICADEQASSPQVMVCPWCTRTASPRPLPHPSSRAAPLEDRRRCQLHLIRDCLTELDRGVQKVDQRFSVGTTHRDLTGVNRRKTKDHLNADTRVKHIGWRPPHDPTDNFYFCLQNQHTSTCANILPPMHDVTLFVLKKEAHQSMTQAIFLPSNSSPIF